MRHETVPAYNEDSRWYALVFFTIVAVILALALGLFDPFGWGGSEPSNRIPKAARCLEAPEKYGGRIFCSVEEDGGAHGYVNPGSMEWEIE
jgi:hypothetical protein